MFAPNLRRVTGLLFVVVPVVFTVCFTLLSTLFEYPAILRQPTADVLAKFQAGGPMLIAVWYVLTLTGLLFVPLALLMHRILAEDTPSTTLTIATVFGSIAGLVQTLGFIRWPFLVPHLAQVYLDPAASEAQRASAAMVFEAFHRYAGMAVGEHLGYLSTGVWTFLIGLLMLRAPRFGRWLGLSGMVLALGIATGLLEPAGWEPAGAINAISYIVWALWLVVVGITMLVRRTGPLAVSHDAPVGV